MDTKGYNATVIGKIMITPDIMIFTINADEARAEFEVGQNMRLGLYG